MPCLIRWTPKGSIDGDILLDMVKTLDVLDVYDDERKEGKTPFILLDGHGSRWELPFLEYINTDATKWSVCIGVRYGTGLWQVGDSAEQNGSYKMAVTQYKRILMGKKQKQCKKNCQIFKHEIPLIVNYAWKKSFARID